MCSHSLQWTREATTSFFLCFQHRVVLWFVPVRSRFRILLDWFWLLPRSGEEKPRKYDKYRGDEKQVNPHCIRPQRRCLHTLFTIHTHLRQNRTEHHRRESFYHWSVLLLHLTSSVEQDNNIKAAHTTPKSSWNTTDWLPTAFVHKS